MTTPADMPELGKDDAALVMYGLRHCAPARDLLGAMDAGRPGITLSTRLDLGSLGNHEAGTGTLAIIGRHQIVRNIARLGAAGSGQGRKDDTILQRERAQARLCKEYGIFHV